MLLLVTLIAFYAIVATSLTAFPSLHLVGFRLSKNSERKVRVNRLAQSKPSETFLDGRNPIKRNVRMLGWGSNIASEAGLSLREGLETAGDRVMIGLLSIGMGIGIGMVAIAISNGLNSRRAYV